MQVKSPAAYSPEVSSYTPQTIAEHRIEESFGQTGLEYLAELREISKLDPHRVVFIKVGGEIANSKLDELADDIDTLTQVGLYPVIVHGAGPQIRQQFAATKLASSEFHPSTNDRITTDTTMTLVEAAADMVTDTIVDALNNRQPGMAVGIKRGVFTATAKPDHGGRTGNIAENGVDETAIADAAKRGQVAVVSFIASSPTGTTYNINADTAAAELAKKIQPHRYIAVSDNPVKRDIASPEYISVLDVDNGLVWDLLDKKVINGGMEKKVRESIRLVRDPAMPDDFKVVILNPENHNILQELFSDAGAGTMILRGEEITANPLQREDCRPLRRLLEECFSTPDLQASLSPDYFSELPVVPEIYRNKRGGLRAAAIVLKNLVKQGSSLPWYLEKLGANHEADGKGLGWMALKEVQRESKYGGGLFLRVDAQKKALIDKYRDHTDETTTEFVDMGKWVVVLSGVAPEDRENCIKFALAQPVTISYAAVSA